MTTSDVGAAGLITETLPRRRAILFIVFLGVVSLFGDMTYEGARSITGPYLGLLGVTATTIGIVSGFGELMGYGARLVSGYVSDRSGNYWAVTIAGYVLNLFAVPLLALAGDWRFAVVLIVAERMGRGIRSPVRDAMLSHAASQTGLGWGFGLHQALDQLGAVIGPLVVSGVLFVGSGYQAAFGWLLIPALLSMTVLLSARYLFPRPHDFELAPPDLTSEGLAPVFWIYIAAVAFIAAGYADFPLIA
jgi:MFS transporter